MLGKDKLIPSSEWLMYGDGCGWLGMMIFTFVMLIPFFIRNHCAKIVWLLLNVSATLTFIFDVGLEVQYGVFLYSFIILWWWKWLQSVKTI
jgi:O-antigen ligase